MKSLSKAMPTKRISSFFYERKRKWSKLSKVPILDSILLQWEEKPTFLIHANNQICDRRYEMIRQFLKLDKVSRNPIFGHLD